MSAVFNPTVVGRSLLMRLRNAQVGASLVNRDYAGDVDKLGATVTITTPTDLTIRDYQVGTPIVVEEMNGTGQTMTVDQASYFAFHAQDVLAVSQYADAFAREAAFRLAAKADEAILAHALDAADSVDVAFGGDILPAIREARAKLSNANVPDEGRFVVVSPDDLSGIERELTNRDTDLGDGVVRRGFQGFLYGFEVYVSNSLAMTADVRHALAGYRGAISFADNIIEVEKNRSLTQFADQVRGLHVYGESVMRPEGLVSIDIDTVA